MKVKIYFGDDLVAIRVPSDIQFDQLYDKICDRLKVPPGQTIELFYKDENTGQKPELSNNADLDVALDNHDKLVIYAQIAEPGN